MKFVFLLVILLSCLSAFSQTNKKIKDLEKRRKQTLIEIENTSKLLSDTKKTTVNLLNRIKLITSQIASRQELVSILDQEIIALAKEEQVVSENIKKSEADLKHKQENYTTAVRGMIHKRQKSDKLLFILSGKSLGESLRRMKYMREYSEWRIKQADEIKIRTKELSEKKLQLEKSKRDKQILLAQRKSEQEQLKKEEQDRQKDMTEANKKQKELQSDLNKKQKQANALNSQIERLIAEEVARQEREAKRIAAEKAKASKGTKSSSEATSSPAQPEKESPESFKLSSIFAANKGKFPMPVTGRYSITTRFGQHHHRQWNVTTNSNGIDIQAQDGAEARSIYKGEVSRVVAFPGYNNCIIVRHGGYYTFYGNIQQVYVKQGQKIEAGQSIGKIYYDSDKGGAELHFQLWKGTTKLNPEPWLKR